MNRIEIAGNIPLNGEIAVQGSKNAALPLMAAAVLHEGKTVLHNCPRILDVEYMAGILRELGCRVVWESGSTLEIDAGNLKDSCVPGRLAGRFRASVILMGSLLGRCKEAILPYPGGCTIGMRPIDLHLKAIEQMGAVTELLDDAVRLFTSGLHGSEIELAFPSVGATENIILAAVLAEGTTRIRGYAAEPEVEELCRFLKAKGAVIAGLGSRELVITGVEQLKDSEHTLIADRIVAGTYLCAAAGTRGKITLFNAPAGHLKMLIALLKKTGARIWEEETQITIDGSAACGSIDHVETAPYPGFPTDMQSQMMALLCRAEGVSRITENLFEERFLAAGELNRLGAKVKVQGKTASIEGVKSLRGVPVTAQELRGGAALVVAGLMADGKTTVRECQYIERGYEDICRDLSSLGADIRKV